MSSVANALLLSALTVSASPATPNIIFLMSDDQGWGDVAYNKVYYQPGAGGTEFTPNPPRTPNLDAMATGPNSILFHRFYSGSAVCSPTRSSVLTGRTPDRDCIFGAEGCGQKPAWKCDDRLPLPPSTFTVAEAVKQLNYSTGHWGKWHLGDFYLKPGAKKGAYEKWPVSHPGIHGFDTWFSTEASASSTTCNCGCKPEWVAEDKGCIIGGGAWQHKAFDCTNYWAFADKAAAKRAECLAPTTSTRDCVANLTSKIPGDDTEYILDQFEPFLKENSEAGKPFLAVLWLHTVHEPHPALPEFYYAYNDTDGNPAGDYLGTITQMDDQIGRLRSMLDKYGVRNDTMLWFTADNGPHPGSDIKDVRRSTNGMRQCKASLFEGGIRVPGILEWPARIQQNRESWVPVATFDYLPTVLDVLGLSHPQPDWAKDGVSLAPLIDDPTWTRPAEKFLGFELGNQRAVIEGEMKLLVSPSNGQCGWETASKYNPKSKGPFLFNLTADPTESEPLNDQQPDVVKRLQQVMDNFASSIENSQANESGCKTDADLW